MIGKRVADNFDGLLNAGEYTKWIDPQGNVNWMCCTPNGHHGNLGQHRVEEHEDGTISVTPSILVSLSTGPVWHGFLKRGVWEAC